MVLDHPLTRQAILLQRGLLHPPAASERGSEAPLRALDLDLASLGFATTGRLRERLAHLSPRELKSLYRWLRPQLFDLVGAGPSHAPLFVGFPHDLPANLDQLWRQRWVSHFLQRADQPCLTCQSVATLHVLKPCGHVVCDRCWDGAAFAACPVCGTKVDLTSPFFTGRDCSPALAGAPASGFAPALARAPGPGPGLLRVLDLGEDLIADAAALVRGWCDRTQPLSADEAGLLEGALSELGTIAAGWLPAGIAMRETAARALAAIERAGAPLPDAVLAAHLRSATDVLRFVAACSGADPGLQGDAGWRFAADGSKQFRTIRRFKVARLPRARRRFLLGLLDQQPDDSLFEDFERHRAYWVWLGEFLHPHEYATRFPRAACAFAQVRRKGPDGSKSPLHHGRGARLEAAIRAGDVPAFLPLLAERPGELARRLDQALRAATTDPEPVLAAFAAAAPACPTPVLLNIWAALPRRVARSPVRVFWPRGLAARAVVAGDRRSILPAPTALAAAAIAEAELLRRFATLPHVGAAIVDDALADVTVPFNARAASPGAVALPRGSRLALPPGEVLRLFLHWCEPATDASTTDLDLSVAFYHADWIYAGVCSYYQLRFPHDGEGDAAAVSAGDYTSAPPPDGATEFIDLTLERARTLGVRYAVMIVNAFSGLPFGKLERAYAGLLRVEDGPGAAFDPTAVAMKFGLAGEHGMYMPLAIDVEAGALHWFDVHSHGQFELNNVATSEKALSTLGPALISYFASGVRPSLRDLALLHAAARADTVFLRGPASRLITRGADEAPMAFLARLRAGEGEPGPRPTDPGFAALYQGDFSLPAAAASFVLFPGRSAGSLAAADLLKP